MDACRPGGVESAGRAKQASKNQPDPPNKRSAARHIYGRDPGGCLCLCWVGWGSGWSFGLQIIRSLCHHKGGARPPNRPLLLCSSRQQQTTRLVCEAPQAPTHLRRHGQVQASQRPRGRTARMPYNVSASVDGEGHQRKDFGFVLSLSPEALVTVPPPPLAARDHHHHHMHHAWDRGSQDPQQQQQAGECGGRGAYLVACRGLLLRLTLAGRRTTPRTTTAATTAWTATRGDATSSISSSSRRGGGGGGGLEAGRGSAPLVYHHRAHTSLRQWGAHPASLPFYYKQLQALQPVCREYALLLSLCAKTGIFVWTRASLLSLSPLPYITTTTTGRPKLTSKAR